MKKRRIDLSVKEQFDICNKETDCCKCKIKLFCWDDNEESVSIVKNQSFKKWLNEEIEIGD